MKAIIPMCLISWFIGVYAPLWFVVLFLFFAAWAVFSVDDIEASLLYIAAPLMLPCIVSTAVYGDMRFISELLIPMLTGKF